MGCSFASSFGLGRIFEVEGNGRNKISWMKARDRELLHRARFPVVALEISNLGGYFHSSRSPPPPPLKAKSACHGRAGRIEAARSFILENEREKENESAIIIP